MGTTGTLHGVVQAFYSEYAVLIAKNAWSYNKSN